jgi:hypothetical protein
MFQLHFLLLLALAQDADPAANLLKGGWTAVDELGAKPEMKGKLAELASGKDPELAWWAGAALAELEAREKAGDAWTPPLRVTLSAKERNAGEVLRELLVLARGRPVDAPEEDPPVTVAFKETPYLEALDEVCRQGGFILARGAGGRLQLLKGEGLHGPRLYRAGFAASIVQLVRRTEVNFREEPTSQLNLQLSLRADPRQRVLDAEPEFVLARAEDDTGRSLLKEGSKPTLRVRAGEGLALAQVVLEVPAPGARKIAVLRGTFTLAVAKKTEEIVFENVSKTPAQERESGGVKAVLKKAERTGDEVRVEVELSAKEKVPWPDTENLTLEDAEGRPFQRWGSSMNGSASGASYRLTFRDREGLGAIDKLRVSVVTESYPRRVFFELRDVVLR